MTDLQRVLVTYVRGGLVTKGWRQADLARAVEVSPKHLSQMMTGRVEGSLTMWDKLLEALK